MGGRTRTGQEVEENVAGGVARVVAVVVGEEALLAPAVEFVGLVDHVVVVVGDDVRVARYASDSRPPPTAVVVRELVRDGVVATAHELRGGQEGVVHAALLLRVGDDGILVHDAPHVHERGGDGDHGVGRPRGLDEHEPRADLVVALRHEVVLRVVLQRGQRVLEEDDVAVHVQHGVLEQQ